MLFVSVFCVCCIFSEEMYADCLLEYYHKSTNDEHLTDSAKLFINDLIVSKTRQGLDISGCLNVLIWNTLLWKDTSISAHGIVALETAASHKNEETCVFAVRQMGRYDPDVFVPFLIKKLDDNRRDVNCEAADVLSRYGRRIHRQLLENYYQDSPEVMRTKIHIIRWTDRKLSGQLLAEWELRYSVP